MTWIKLDDDAVDHPKIESLSDRAFRWWIKGLSYASRFLTDGILPAVFWKKAPTGARAELTDANLWLWRDPHFEIHDYLEHQQSRADVEKERRRNRDRRNGLTDRRTAGTTDGRTEEKPRPEKEKRDQRSDPELPTTTIVPHQRQRSPGLIVGGGEYVRLLETHAYVGAKLRVPKVLHAELMTKSGANADEELRAWYARLDEQLEQDGKGTGDVFVWLRPRHQAFAIEKGWVDAPAVNGQKPKFDGIEAAQERLRAAGRIK